VTDGRTNGRKDGRTDNAISISPSLFHRRGIKNEREMIGSVGLMNTLMHGSSDFSCTNKLQRCFKNIKGSNAW